MGEGGGGEGVGVPLDLTLPENAWLLQGPEERGTGQGSLHAISYGRSWDPLGQGAVAHGWLGLSPSWVSGMIKGRELGGPQGSPVWGCSWGMGRSP